MSSEPKPFLELGRPRIVHSRPGGLRLPLIERLRAARGMRQAVVKVVSYARGLKRVAQLMDYISRKGALESETDTGEILVGRDQTKALAENWAADFGDRKNGRDAAHIVFSMPPGSDPEKLKASVRIVLSKEFQDHESVFGIHQDKSHPHAHVVIKMRGRQASKKLRLNKPELYHLREAFAAAAREQGIPLAASPRAARGVGRKGDRQAIFHMRKRGVVPRADRESAQEIAKELRKGEVSAKPWEKAMAERHKRERRFIEIMPSTCESKPKGSHPRSNENI